MKERTIIPEAVHTAFWTELTGLLGKYEKEHGLTPEVMLAITSKAVGMLIALQDPGTMSRDRAIRTVMANIEAGNAQAITDIAMGKLTR